MRDRILAQKRTPKYVPLLGPNHVPLLGPNHVPQMGPPTRQNLEPRSKLMIAKTAFADDPVGTHPGIS